MYLQQLQSVKKSHFRRFAALLEKTDAQLLERHQHNGGRIGVISVIEGGDEALAKQISMHRCNETNCSFIQRIG